MPNPSSNFMATHQSSQPKTTIKNSEIGEIATELIRARTRAGMSQSQLAERSGLSRNAVMAYESGRNKPGAREIKLLCEALKLTPNKLIFGSEEPFKQTENVFDALGLTSENQEAVLFSVVFNMLGRDERQAVITLVHNLLEARHGEKFREMIEVTKIMATEFETGEAGKIIAEAITPTAINKIAEQVQTKTDTQRSD